jgi:hypothetical protein
MIPRQPAGYFIGHNLNGDAKGGTLMLNWNTGELELPNLTVTKKTMLADVVNVFGSDVRIFVREPNLVTAFKKHYDVGGGFTLYELLFSSKGRLSKIVLWHESIPDDVPVHEDMLLPLKQQMARYNVEDWCTITLEDSHQVIITLK